MDYVIQVTYKKVKNLRMRIRDGNVYVTAPLRTSKATIQSFIDKNQDFIRKYVPIQQKKKEAKILHSEDEVIILGKKYRILPTHGMSKVTENFIFVNSDCPDIRIKIKDLFKQDALEYFRMKTSYYYKLMKIPTSLPEVKIKDVRSRWGSYNRKYHCITYASELIFKSDDLCNLIVIHELSHIFEFNHSARFYAILKQYCPDYKILQKKLKEE